jgi:hypothetical protein
MARATKGKSGRTTATADQSDGGDKEIVVFDCSRAAAIARMRVPRCATP